MIRKLLNCIIFLGAIALSGCTKDTLHEGTGSELDFSRMEAVTLSSISTATNTQSEQAAQSRAGGVTSPMAVGKTFRLYAFPKGVTNMNNLLLTRTYTIKDTAGEPVLDTNQEGLFLPVGDVDIFLVGPVEYDENEAKRDVNGNPLPPSLVEVAGPYRVYPRYGVDLISSKTTLTVKEGANQFQATPLHHRMAQMEVVVRRPNDASYTNLNVTSISVMNQTLTGDFTFNDAGGEITPAEEGTETLLPTILTTTLEQEFRGTMYVIPRKQVQLRIGVSLTCKVSGVDENVDRRMESGIMTEPLVAGQMNRFITKPYLSEKLIFRLRLMPWDDISMDDIEVPALDNVLFSYCGLDAPRIIDGRMCIPDRSGNNRHGELVGDIRYNAEEKYYYAGAVGAYIKVPVLGEVPVYTFEITASSKRGAKSRAAYFKDDVSATMEVYPPWTENQILFYAGRNTGNNSLSIQYNRNDLALMNNMAVYAFTCDGSRKLTIRRNGIELASRQGDPYNGMMNDNRLLLWAASDNKTEEPLRMYAARMTTSVNSEAIKNNYRNDIANFAGITVDRDGTKRDYIEDGLILDLRGTTGYSTSLVSGKYVWPDASRAKNHAVVMSFDRPSRGSNYFAFNGSSQYMQLLRTLGTQQNFTVEIVAKLGTQKNTILNFASSPKGGDNYREFSLHLPYNTILCYAPYSTLYNRKQLNVDMRDNLSYTYSYMTSNPNQWSFTRHNENGKSFLEAWLNGNLEATSNRDEVSLMEMRYCFIGSNGPDTPQWFNSSIYAIRVYNRPLTDLERQHNYQTDKLKYNLVP